MTGIVPAKLTTLVVISGDSWTALVLALPKNQASAYVEEHRRLTRLTMASVLLLLFAFVYVCFLLCLITLAFWFLVCLFFVVVVCLFVCLFVFVFCCLFACLLLLASLLVVVVVQERCFWAFSIAACADLSSSLLLP